MEGSDPTPEGAGDHTVKSYLVVMAVSVVATMAAVPPLRWLSLRVDAMAHPTDRSVHARSTPVLGGAALLLGVVAGLATI